LLARIIIVWFDVEANIARGVRESLKFTTWSVWVIFQFLVKSFTSSSSSSLVKCGIKRLDKKPRLFVFVLFVIPFFLFFVRLKREAAGLCAKRRKAK
jgi:hypothetical protein